MKSVIRYAVEIGTFRRLTASRRRLRGSNHRRLRGSNHRRLRGSKSRRLRGSKNRRLRLAVKRADHGPQPRGFTLVEMLVSVALVVLMMSMFAEIFQLAANSMGTQRGIAENDQRARSLITILRADLDKRTFRVLIPFAQGEDSSSNGSISFGNRQGYFYISTNDPDDETDDVLQFTVRSSITKQNTDETPYYGKATLLAGDINGDGSVDSLDSFLNNPNQPEADDGQVVADGTSSSTAAEISFFLRNGNLYRRVLLVREPLALAGAEAQPTNSNGVNLFDSTNMPLLYPITGVTTGNFWDEFDFSAYYTATGAVFSGAAALDNGTGSAAAAALGQTYTRFGHNHATGLPREFVNNNTEFLGRFTHEETSHEDFNYPQALAVVGGSNVNPMSPTTTLNLANGVVSAFAGGLRPSRRSEDLLLSNVHAFRVEVWDEAVGRFVPMGHNNGTGDFGQAINANNLPALSWQIGRVYYNDDIVTSSAAPNSGYFYRCIPSPPPKPNYGYGISGTTEPSWTQNVGDRFLEDLNGNGVHDDGEVYWECGQYSYGPRNFTNRASNRVFDTWHPNVNVDGASGGEPPPFRPMVNLANTRQWAPKEIDVDGDGTVDLAEDFNRNGSFDTPTYAVGDIVFPTKLTFPYHYVPTSPIPPASEATRKFSRGPFHDHPTQYTYAYRCVKGGTAGTTPPAWKTTPGERFFEDKNGNLQVDANEPVWETVYNMRPLRAIRITVRYLHISSNQMRQVTLVHSMVD